MANHQEYRRITTVVGATGRKLRMQMRDPETGQPFDLTGYVSATLTAKFRGDAANKIDEQACVIEVGTNGWVYYYPLAAEIDTAGDLISRVELDPGTGTIDFSKRLIIEVEEVV